MSPADNLADFDDLGYLAHRLRLAFAARPVMPKHALIYRLAEVGPRPFDARWLERALGACVRPRDGRPPTLYQPVPGLFLPVEQDEPPLSSDDADVATASNDAQSAVLPTDVAEASRPPEEWAADALPIVRRLGDANLRPGFDALVDGADAVLRDLLPSHQPAVCEDDGLAPATALAGDVVLARPCVRLTHRPERGRPVHVWITHELPWIAPDDSRLWRQLRLAAAADARLLVLARKVDPTLFPVLKAVGAAAVQVFWHLVDDGAAPVLHDVATRLGWPPIRRAESLADHRGWTQFATCVRAVADSPPATRVRTDAALRTALDALPSDGITAPSPADLRAWTERLNLVLPERWHRVLSCWDALRAGPELPPAPLPERRPGRGDGGTRAADAPNDAPIEMEPGDVADGRVSPDHPSARVALDPSARVALDPSPTIAPQPATERPPRGPTVVTRSGVAADVDRATWHELNAQTRERGRRRTKP